MTRIVAFESLDYDLYAPEDVAIIRSEDGQVLGYAVRKVRKQDPFPEWPANYEPLGQPPHD
jgi:hypothetical protein